MNKISIPNNIKNLSQLLEDGLVMCDSFGSILSYNNLAKQYLGDNLKGKNICNFISTKEFNNLDESYNNGAFNDQFSFQNSLSIFF